MGSKQLELQSSCDELRVINEKLWKKVEFVETKAMQLGVSYVVLQTLMFSSVSQSSAMSCDQWWVPFWLSTLVAALFGPTFVGMIREWLRMRFEHDVNLLEQHMIHHRMWRLSEQNMLGDDEMVVKPDMFRVYKQRASMCLVGCALLAYTLVVLRGSYSILCDGKVGSKV